MQPYTQQQQAPAPKQGGFLNLFGGIVASAIGVQQQNQPKPQGPVRSTNEAHLDDMNFCRNYNGLNILITGATGTIGHAVVDALLKNSQPAKVGLFCRDDGKLPTQVQSLCGVPATDKANKRLFAYECDFVDPIKITTKVHQALRNMDGHLDAIFFCHGVINFMGGVDGNLPEWDLVHKINVRSTMQILSICMPFLRMTQGSATILSSSAGEVPWAGHTIYNSAMATLNMMVRCAALENAHHQVRVNAVAPGYVRSETSRSNQDFQNALTSEQNSGIIGEAALNTPLMGYTEPVTAGQEGQFTYQIQEPLDVAQSMLWQGSYDASFMNGEIMVIDGGVSNTTSNYSQYVQQAEYADRLLAHND